MIRILKATQSSLATPNEYRFDLAADTKYEVENGGTIEGMPENAVIGLGSTVYTAAAEVALRQSDGTWLWV